MKRCYLHQTFLLFVIGEVISAKTFEMGNCGDAPDSSPFFVLGRQRGDFRNGLFSEKLRRYPRLEVE